jgi:hypothetical protein
MGRAAKPPALLECWLRCSKRRNGSIAAAPQNSNDGSVHATKIGIF